MQSHPTAELRNIALVGHTGAGKTSLIRQILQHTDTNLSNQPPSETLDVEPWWLEWHGIQFNLLDSPGYPDLSGRAMEVMAAADTAMLVLDASRGIEVVSQQLMEAARQRHLARMIVVNKIDDQRADPAALLAAIQDAFGHQCLALNLPNAERTDVADCYFRPAHSTTLFDSVEQVHDAVVDQVVEEDETLMEQYLEQGRAPSTEQMHDPFEQALRDDHLIPVMFCSAKQAIGIEALMRVMAELCPHPHEGNPPEFIKADGELELPVTLSQRPDDHALAHVFKISADPYVGKLGLVRVYQGTLKPGMQLFVGDNKKPIRVVHLYRLQGNKLEEIEQALPGDICALSKINELHFDAVLHDSMDEAHYHLKPLRLPPPMFGLALRPARKGQEQRLSDVLQRLCEADPSLRVEQRPRVNETILWGLGEIHLRSVLDSMARDYQLDVETDPPTIEYRETITQTAEGQYRHKKQTGGAGQFGEVHLRIEPLARGQGFEFIDKVVGGAIPGQFIPAVEKGVRQAMEEGALASAPMQDIRVTVYDGKHHPVDSKEIAFVSAGRKAFLEAFQQAHPILLEPIARIRVTCPEQMVGDITGELATKQGLIEGTESITAHRVAVEAQAPLRELQDFATRLKSLTSGEGYFTMNFSHYAPVTENLQQQLCREAQALAD